MTAKRGSRGTQGSARTRKRPALADKYAHLTVYDPKRRAVVDAAGNEVTLAGQHVGAGPGLDWPTPLTLTAPEVGALAAPVPALAEYEKLYACEAATHKTVAQLASLAGMSIMDLEVRRIGYRPVVPVAACEQLPPDRRRCSRCPFWTLHPEATPF